MLRRFIATSLAIALSVAVLADAKAGVYITSNGDFHLGVTQDSISPPLTGIIELGGSTGRAYANAIASLSLGTEIRTVTVQTLNSAVDGITFEPFTVDGKSVVAFSAARAVITGFNAQGAPILDIFEARLFLAAREPSSGFAINNPDSWNQTLDNIFAEYTLGVRADVLDGNVVSGVYSASTPFPAALINTQTPNEGSFTQAQQRLVFLEDSSEAQNAGETPGAGPGTGGDNFMFNVEFTPFGTFMKQSEGFLVKIATSIQQNLILDNAGPGGTPLVQTDIQALNRVAGLAGFENLGGDYTGFATYNTDTVTDFNPFGGVVGGAFNGDVIAIFEANANPINYMVPEPGSLAVFGIAGIALLGAVGARRRKALAKSAVVA